MYFISFVSHNIYICNATKKSSSIARDMLVLLWNNIIINVFLKLLQKIYEIGKKTNNTLKSMAWTEFWASIQNNYPGNKHITVVKIYSKLNYIYIFK